MNKRLMREYRKFRGQAMLVGHDAECAMRAARTELLWDKLESAGLVKIEALPDESYEWDGEREREQFGDDGAWGTVGYFRLSEDDEWESADSVWGHVGYRNVLDPVENCYVVDIKAQTIQALRESLKSRCPLCRQPHPHNQPHRN